MSKYSFKNGDVVNDRYRIIGQIGSGTFSEVYHCFDTKLKIYKAIKILGEQSELSKLVDDLNHEARILANLNHPAIVRIFDIDFENDYILLDMEYFEGQNLREFINSHSHLSGKDRLNIAINLAYGIKYAHDHLVIHQDIKPHNILINEKKEVKLTDFGIAANLEIEKKSDKIQGTQAYLPPEIKWGEKPNVTSDIFSFGIVLYELFYNSYPFKLDSNEAPNYEIPKKIKSSKNPKNKILKKCLEIYPEDRYQSMDEIISDLKKLQRQVLPYPFSKFFSFIEKADPNDPKNKYNLKQAYLMLFLIFLIFFLLEPYFVMIFKHHSHKKNLISIQPGNYHTFINFRDIGNKPQKISLEYGDFIQLKDDNGNIVYEFSYKDEPQINIRFKKNLIYKNGILVGKELKNSIDLLTNRKLEFLNIDNQKIIFLKNSLENISKLGIVINLKKNVNPIQILNLPSTISGLSIDPNSNIKKLYPLKNKYLLSVLDISGNPQISLNSVNSIHSISKLNLSNCGIINLNSLFRLKQLSSLDISKSNLVNLNGIQNFGKLKNITLTTYPGLSFNNLKRAENLTDIKVENYANLLPNQKKIYNDIKNQNKSANILSDSYSLIEKILILLFIILIFALINIIKNILKTSFSKPLIRKKNHKKEEKNTEEKEESIDLIPQEIDKLIETIKKKIDIEHFYSPENNNALHYLKQLSLSEPRNKSFKKLHKLASKEILKKIMRHKKNNEYEGIYITASESLKIDNNLKLQKWIKISEDKLLKNNEKKLNFIHINGKTFDMGDFLNSGFKNASVHKIKLTDFEISATNVTNEQFCKFLNEKGNQKTFRVEWINLLSPHCMIEVKNGVYIPKHPYNAFPVIEVSWYGAFEYCKWLGGTLPTEAEWEFVARNGGENILYPTGDDISLKEANYLENKNDNRWHSVVPIKNYPPNKLGIYEICGNVMEWCLDIYDKDYYKDSPKVNPKGKELDVYENGEQMQSLRGGAWSFDKKKMITFYRSAAKANTRANFIGFRVVKRK